MRERGLGWVVAQFVLVAIVVAVWLAAADVGPSALIVAGVVLMLAGAFVAASAAAALGRSLTPFPQPKATGALVTAGPFRVVRHPIYAGGVLFLAGGSLVLSRWALIPSAVLTVLWALKARVEERHLARAFPEYAAYARRVRARLIPFVY